LVIDDHDCLLSARRSLLDRFANADIGPTAADVAGHRFIDSASVGCGLLARSAAADMIWPDWQYPHCGTSRSSQALWILAPGAVAPIASMVVISELPMLSSGVMHERVGSPLTCTVQAPQSAMPQPNFVPVMPSTSRNTQSSGVSPSASTLWV
jgi:hypothetical protein